MIKDAWSRDRRYVHSTLPRPVEPNDAAGERSWPPGTTPSASRCGSDGTLTPGIWCGQTTRPPAVTSSIQPP